MTVRRLILVFVIVLGFLGSAAAAEAVKIDRTIGKEPKYESKTPKYLLLLFGEKAQTRVWVVFDEKRTYVDLNANGDLTDEGESFKEGSLRKLTVEDPAIKAKHTNLSIGKSSPYKGVPRYHVTVDVNDTLRQYTFAQLAGKAASDAAVAHFGGPMQAKVSGKNFVLKRGKDNDLGLCLVTQHEGTQWVAVDHGRGVPKDVHPLAEITFPAKEPGGKPIKLKIPLTQRC